MYEKNYVGEWIPQTWLKGAKNRVVLSTFEYVAQDIYKESGAGEGIRTLEDTKSQDFLCKNLFVLVFHSLSPAQLTALLPPQR